MELAKSVNCVASCQHHTVIAYNINTQLVDDILQSIMALKDNQQLITVDDVTFRYLSNATTENGEGEKLVFK